MSHNSFNKVQKLIGSDNTLKASRQEVIEGEFVDLDRKSQKKSKDNNSLELLNTYSELLKTSKYFEGKPITQIEKGFILLDPSLVSSKIEKRQLDNKLKSLDDLRFADLGKYLLDFSPKSNPELLEKIKDYYKTQVGEKAVELDMIRENPFKSTRDLAILAGAHGIEGIMTARLSHSSKTVEKEMEREQEGLELGM